MQNTNVLILEDDLETLKYIFELLHEIENEKKISISTTQIPDYIQTEEFINKNPKIKFDILLLDRDCFLGGSFHNIDLKLFDLSKVISISSMPGYNEEAKNLGVTKSILKDYTNLRDFKAKLKEEILLILT